MQKFCEIPENAFAEFLVIVSKSERATTKSGNPFYKLTVRDAKREAKIHVWHNLHQFSKLESGEIKQGSILAVSGSYRVDEKWGPQIDMSSLVVIDEKDPRVQGAELIRKSRFNVSEMMHDIESLVDSIQDSDLRLVTRATIERVKTDFKRVPAANKNHHAYVGGLLEHTLSVARLANNLASKYIDYYPAANIDRDQVVAGAILHDIGKVFELSVDGEYTDEGKLFGHIVQGFALVSEIAKTLSESPAVRRLLHSILSHQGKLEWASPVEPKTFEALIIHMADEMDAKANMLSELLAVESSSSWTERNNKFGREFLRNE